VLVLTVHQRRSSVLPSCWAVAFQPGDFNVVARDCRPVCLNLMILTHYVGTWHIVCLVSLVLVLVFLLFFYLK
jgi:hypothetical protein